MAEDTESQSSLWRDALLWRGMASIPSGMVRPHVVSDAKRTTVYVGGGNTGKIDVNRTVFKFDLASDSWSRLPITPYHTFSLALVGDLVTVVGGVSVLTSLMSDALVTFEESIGKWSHNRYPAMPSKRSCTSATTIAGYLVVVGGIGDKNSYLKTVEVLDTSANQWFTACEFPKPINFMSIASSSSRVFMTGGLTNTGAVGSIYSCTLEALLRSCTDKGTTQNEQVWQELIATPCFRSGCIVVNEKLVVFGGVANKQEGLDTSDGISSSVYVLDSIPDSPKDKDAWRLLGKMAGQRSSMSLCMTGPTSLLMVGGYVDTRNWINSLTTDVAEVVNITV